MATEEDITEEDITDERDSDVELLDEKISDAIAKKNALAISDRRRLDLSTTINELMNSRTELHIQELKAGLEGMLVSGRACWCQGGHVGVRHSY